MPNFPLAFLIPAHNEAASIGSTVSTLRTFVNESDCIIVIDDGSTDATAEVAGRAGARVASRPAKPEQSGKGAALGWFMAHCTDALNTVAGVIILDADSRVDPQFPNLIRARLAAGQGAVQGFIEPMTEAGAVSLAGQAAAFTTLLEQRVDDRLRTRLGWPVRLRGTGMGFRTEVFRTLVTKLHTQAEDVEMSLYLAWAGVLTHFAPEAIVYDPLPVSGLAATLQRARWLRGQWQVWRSCWRDIGALALRGPWAWSLMGELLLKPRSLLMASKLGLMLILFLLVGLWWPMRFVAALLGLNLVLDMAYLLLGLGVVAGPGWQASLAMVSTWGQSLALALRTPAGWLSVRDRTHTP